MNNLEIHQNTNNKEIMHDFSFVKNPARIAIYDNLKAPPQILEIKPADTNIFIQNLSSCIYDEVQRRNGNIPYTVIREICENFIHANFSEIVVSILDNGKTVRFSDQGPGFVDIDKAKLPGFTSATEEMKHYIRGVGSGLPTVEDYINYSDGIIKIENNIHSGSVVTISMLENLENSIAFSKVDKKANSINYTNKISSLMPSLTAREENILKIILNEGSLGITQINSLLNIPVSTIHKDLTSLEQYGLIESLPNKKRILTDFGFSVTKVY